MAGGGPVLKASPASVTKALVDAVKVVGSQSSSSLLELIQKDAQDRMSFRREALAKNLNLYKTEPLDQLQRESIRSAFKEHSHRLFKERIECLTEDHSIADKASVVCRLADLHTATWRAYDGPKTVISKYKHTQRLTINLA